jgi:hypothetical protein
MKTKFSCMPRSILIALLGLSTFIPSGVLSISPSYAAVIDVNSASALGANDSIGWGQIFNLTGGQPTQLFTGPLNVVSTNGNGATVSVGGDNMFFRVDQAPRGDYYGNFPPGMQLIDSWHNYYGITISFDRPVYGGGAQVGAGYYGHYDAIVMAFSGAHLQGTYSVAATTTTDGLNNPAPFIGILSSSPNITSLVFFADHDVFSPSETTLGTLSLNVKVHPAHDLDAGVLDPAAGVPEPSTWAMMLLGFAGLGFAFRQSRRNVSLA